MGTVLLVILCVLFLPLLVFALVLVLLVLLLLALGGIQEDSENPGPEWAGKGGDPKRRFGQADGQVGLADPNGRASRVGRDMDPRH